MTFLRNAWYVAAWASEIVDKPVLQRILGEPIVFFRDSEARIAAMSDLCPHRFAPLHRGKVVGDAIECPYHGLRFDAHGGCVFSPFDAANPPTNAKIRTYPVIERDTFIWVWMGEAERAQEAMIPDFHWLNERDQFTFTGDGKLTQPIAYELVIDNLLDLSHGQFLHPTTLGNGAMANGVSKTRLEGNQVFSERWNPDGDAPTLFTAGGVTQPTDRVDFWNDMRWDPPSSYYLQVGVTPTGEPRENGAYFGSAHMLTPVDETTTVYRYKLWRTFACDSAEVTAAIEHVVEIAFTQEDEPMISAVQANMAGRDFWEMKPLILEGDRAGILARRTMQKLLKQEAGPQDAQAA